MPMILQAVWVTDTIAGLPWAQGILDTPVRTGGIHRTGIERGDCC